MLWVGRHCYLSKARERRLPRLATLEWLVNKAIVVNETFIHYKHNLIQVNHMITGWCGWRNNKPDYISDVIPLLFLNSLYRLCVVYSFTLVVIPEVEIKDACQVGSKDWHQLYCTISGLKAPLTPWGIFTQGLCALGDDLFFSFYGRHIFY